MKTIKIFVVAFLMLTFISCSKENEPSVDNSEIVGKWKLEEYYYTGSSKGNFEGMDLESTYDITTENPEAYLELLSDNTFKSSGTLDYIMTMEFYGEELSQNLRGVNFTGNGNWNIEGTMLTVSNQVGSVNSEYIQQAVINTLKIDELTNNRMVLSFNEETEVTYSGLKYSVKMEGKQIYSR